MAYIYSSRRIRRRSRSLGDALDDILKAGASSVPGFLFKSAAQQQADAALAQLKSTGKVGDVLSDALKGTSNPAAILSRAETLASKYGGDALKKATYETIYAQGRTGLEALQGYLNKTAGGYVQTGANVLEQGMKLSTEAKMLIGRLKSSDSIDATGIIDLLGILGSVAVSTAGLVRGLGGGETATDVAAEILDWTGLAVGCGTAIAAGAAVVGVGAVVGAAGCLVGVLSKIFSYQSTPVSIVFQTLSKGKLRAVFVPTQEQLGCIAADAARLAAVLRYCYGVKTYKEIYDRLSKAHDESLTTYYPVTPAPSLGTTSSAAPAGYDAYSVLIALSTNLSKGSIFGTLFPYRVISWDFVTSGLHNTHEPSRLAAPLLYGAQLIPVPDAYFVDTASTAVISGMPQPLGAGVITPDAFGAYPLQGAGFTIGNYDEIDIHKAAEVARRIGNDIFSQTLVFDTNRYNMPKMTNKLGTQFGGGPVFEFKGHCGTNLFEPYLYYDELINFFAAVSLVDVNKDPERLYSLLTYGQPVRHWGVPDEKWGVPEFLLSHYSTKCWSNSSDYTFAYPCGNLAKLVLAKDLHALRIVGYIRLHAAFSYLHQVYMWGQNKTGSLYKRVDPIALLPDPSKDPSVKLLRAPVDPRSKLTGKIWVSPSVQTLYAQIRARESVLAPVVQEAKAQALKDHKVALVAGPATVYYTGPTFTATKIAPTVADLLLQGDPNASDACKKSCVTLKSAGNTKVCGVPAATKDWRPICCLSLYYDENAARCYESASTPYFICDPECLKTSNYTLTAANPLSGLGQTLQMQIVSPAGLQAAMAANVQALRLYTWNEYLAHKKKKNTLIAVGVIAGGLLLALKFLR